MKKYKIIVKNGMRDKHGLILGNTDPKTKRIAINVKAKPHKDKRELASTIKHELMHVTHPKLTEKEVYKRTRKTKISPAEQSALLKKLHRKDLNSKVGALKRRFKMKREEEVVPGTFINKAKEESRNVAQQSDGMSVVKRVAISGLV